ncbi:MAG: Hsp70 family protein [Microbacterium sp.]
MTASFTLAVDVGTSRTAAAIARIAPDGAITTEPFRLGRRADTAPSVVFVADGEIMFGDAAERRGIWQPERLIREVKRRIGDGVPFLVADERFSAEKLYAATVAWVIDTVIDREGRSPAAVSVTIPVTWGDHRRELVRAALAREGWADVDLITEPEAAVHHYESTHPLLADGVIGVYDLGGGTFDAAIVRKTEQDGLVVLGTPRGLADFGGADLDDLLFRHVLDAADLPAEDLAGGESVRLALSALRRDCIDAKEALSFDSEAVVPLLLGTRRHTVRIVRSEFESVIETRIGSTIDVFTDAVAAAGVSAPDLQAILLTGGSSRIPRIAQLLSEELDLPILVDTDPKATVARGAARVAAEEHLVDATDVMMDAATDASSAPFPAQIEPRRRRAFAVGPALAVAAGALVLAGGVALSLGLVPIGAPQEGSGPSPTPSQSIERVNADRAEQGSRPSAEAREPETVEPAEPLPVETPLLTPAPASDRIQNLQDPLDSDATADEQ